MRLILISDSKEFDEELDILHELFEAGLENFHIRKPKMSTRSLRKYISSIDKKFHKHIVIHSHHELAAEFHIKGIHLTESHKSKNFLSTWLKLKYIAYKRGDIQVSTSFHALHSLRNYKSEYSYVFLSPIFDSISKVGYRNRFNEDTLEKAIKASQYKVIAMGGIDETKIEKIHEYGFDGFALLGGIWQSNNPVEEFKKILSKCRTLNLL